MKSVKGEFSTKYGSCRFRMYDGLTATIFLGTEAEPSITCHRVEYNGQMTMYRKDGESPWTENSGYCYIRRVDGEEINYRGYYFKMKQELADAFIAFITDQRRKDIIILAVLAGNENERASLVSARNAALKNLQQTETALYEWDDSAKGIILKEFRKQAEKITSYSLSEN